jgi:hypothetical protein
VEAIGELPIIGGLVIQRKILRSHSNINKLHGVEGLGTSEDKKNVVWLAIQSWLLTSN